MLKSAVELNRAGLLANRAGDTHSALAYFLQATALDPTAPNYLLSAANMLSKLGQTAQAIALYRRVQALELNEYQAKMANEKLAAAMSAEAEAIRLEAEAEAAAVMMREEEARAQAAVTAAAMLALLDSPPATLAVDGALQLTLPASSSSTMDVGPPSIVGAVRNRHEEMGLSLQSVLGRGSYGTVWRAHDAQRGPVAVKVVPLGADALHSDSAHAMQTELAGEIALLTRAHHPNVVSFFTAFVSSEKPEVWVVMELAELGAFHGIVRTLGPLPAAEVGCVLREALMGLLYLHDEMHVLHRDVKAGNLLLTAAAEVRTCRGRASRPHHPTDECCPPPSTSCTGQARRFWRLCKHRRHRSTAAHRHRWAALHSDAQSCAAACRRAMTRRPVELPVTSPAANDSPVGRPICPLARPLAPLGLPVVAGSLTQAPHTGWLPKSSLVAAMMRMQTSGHWASRRLS